MAGLPRIHAPLACLGDVEGVTVVVITVEVWPGQVSVRVAAARDSVTERLDAAFAADVARWDAGSAEDLHDPPEHPEHPAVDLLRRATPRLGDDRDGVYRLTSGQVSGTDTEWRAEWHFRPAPAADVRTLVITAPDVDGARPVVVALAQPPSDPAGRSTG